MDLAPSGLFHQLFSQKQAPTGFSGLLADTQVCSPEQDPSLSMHSLILGWPAGCAGECRKLEKCSALCVTQQKHEDAFEERKDPAG